MSRKGNCYDNSVMENFFRHYEIWFLYFKGFEGVEKFKTELDLKENWVNEEQQPKLDLLIEYYDTTEKQFWILN